MEILLQIVIVSWGLRVYATRWVLIKILYTNVKNTIQPFSEDIKSLTNDSESFPGF